MSIFFRLLLAALALFSASALAQSPDAQDTRPPALFYADGGFGLYGNLGKSNPNYNADAGVDLNHNRLFAEFEGGADTANESGGSTGYTYRLHGLLFYRGKSRWSYGGGVHYSEFTAQLYKKHDLWPTLALLYERGPARVNFQYLFPGENTDYHEQGPLVDLRVHLIKGFYYRQRTDVLFYRDALQSPPAHHVGSENTFGVLYVFGKRH